MNGSGFISIGGDGTPGGISLQAGRPSATLRAGRISMAQVLLVDDELGTRQTLAPPLPRRSFFQGALERPVAHRRAARPTTVRALRI
jgi:hypothetical protein